MSIFFGIGSYQPDQQVFYSRVSLVSGETSLVFTVWDDLGNQHHIGVMQAEVMEDVTHFVAFNKSNNSNMTNTTSANESSTNSSAGFMIPKKMLVLND